MLFVANTVKLIAEIALMALLGQWVLGLLAGARREQNLFYQILSAVGRPFVAAARFVTPRIVLDRHLPLVAFLVLAFIWLVATFMRIRICLEIGVEMCK
jgi:hypothetical protein